MEQNMNEAFAKIVSVENGSPAEEAGLKPEDHIINFNGILYKGVSHNPLITLSEIVKSKIGEERQAFKLLQRKNKIDKVLRSKRLPPSPPKGQIGQQTQFGPEVKEDAGKEAPGEEKGYLDLSKHRSKRPRRSNKKCWICKSENHFKRAITKLDASIVKKKTR